MEDQEQRRARGIVGITRARGIVGRTRARETVRGGRGGRGGRGTTPSRPVIRINEALRLPRQRTFNVEINGYQICTTVTSSPFEIEKWVQDTCNYFRLRPLVVGISVQMGYIQTSVQYYPYRETSVVVDILQLCVQNRCLIIQLSRTPFIPQTLRWFLYVSDHRFVGIFNGSGPEWILCNDKRHRIVLPGWNFVNLVHRAVGSGQDTSMEAFARREFGWILEFDREMRDGYWGEEVLNESQVVLACLEAYVAYRIGIKWRVYRFWR